MKRILSIFICTVILALLAGCKSNPDNVSSIEKTASEVTADVSSELYKNDFGENSKSKADNTKTESKDQYDQIDSDNQSGKREFPDADVQPSEIDNPTGIYSAGRKDNNGDDWKLTLVNPWNTLQINYKINLSNVDSRFGDSKEFDSRAVKYLNNMCEAAANDGISLSVISSFRTYDYQQMLFSNEENEYKSYHPGCSEEEAVTGAATEVARPGTSEHNLGLAVDFNSVEESFENTDAYKWLREHSAEYGFIMRYAKEKQKYTGVIYEPWHYRFVGVENAKKIEDSGLCLEEYIKKFG